MNIKTAIEILEIETTNEINCKYLAKSVKMYLLIIFSICIYIWQF